MISICNVFILISAHARTQCIETVDQSIKDRFVVKSKTLPGYIIFLLFSYRLVRTWQSGRALNKVDNTIQYASADNANA